MKRKMWYYKALVRRCVDWFIVFVAFLLMMVDWDMTLK